MTTAIEIVTAGRNALSGFGLRSGRMALEIEWHVGDVVRKLRQLRRWNQSKLAEKAGLNKGTIVAVERNISAGIERGTYEAVARAFLLSVGELFSLVPRATTTERGAETPAPAEFQSPRKA